MSAKKIAVAVAVVCVLVMAIFLLRPGISTSAQAPEGTRTLPYSGQLANSGQTAVDGAYDFTFSLYDAPEAGNLLWSEKQTGVAVSGGKFSTDLGVTVAFPASLSEFKEAWLEVSLRGPAETDFTILSPRQLFSPDAPLSIDALACPHNHFTDNWTGDNVNWGVRTDNAGTGDGLRVYSKATAANYAAVFASNYAATGVGKGVWAHSSYGVGVYAESSNNDGLEATTYAPYANAKSAIYAHSTDGNGVWGVSTNRWGVTGISTNSWGLVGAGQDASGTDDLGDLWLDGARGEILTGERLNLSSDWNVNIMLDRDNDDTDGKFYVYTNGNLSWIMFVDQLGNLGIDGNYSIFSSTDDYGKRQLFGMASTEARFEDFGSAVLLKGVATVAFDPIFAQTINANLDYQVFLTPVCQEPVVLFVTTKTPAGFTVQGVTLSNEPSNCSFDYRITAKRLGSETLRLDQMSTTSDVPTQ